MNNHLPQGLLGHPNKYLHNPCHEFSSIASSQRMWITINQLTELLGSDMVHTIIVDEGPWRSQVPSTSGKWSYFDSKRTKTPPPFQIQKCHHIPLPLAAALTTKSSLPGSSSLLCSALLYSVWFLLPHFCFFPKKIQIFLTLYFYYHSWNC